MEILVEGGTLTPDTELLVDFTDLKADLKSVLDSLDHRDLNQHPAFIRHNPSSENISAYIYKELKSLLEERKVKLHSVTVAETPAQSATYLEI